MSFVRDAPAMIAHNFNVACGVSNGTRCTFVAAHFKSVRLPCCVSVSYKSTTDTRMLARVVRIKIFETGR